MVEIREIAKNIQDELNEISTEYDFAVIPIVGDYIEPGTTPGARPVINAALKPLPSTIVPIRNLNNFYMTFNLEFIVKKIYAEKVSGVIQEFVTRNVGAGKRIGEYVGIVNCDVPMVGAAAVLPEVGQSVPMVVTVYYQFIKSGVLANECAFKLNGEELLVLDASLPRARIAQTDNILNREEMQSAVGQQGITIHVTIPYLKTAVTSALVNDIVHGKLDTVYKFEYSDGVVRIGDKDYAQYVVLSNGSLNYQAGKIVTISAEFLIARGDIYEERIAELEAGLNG